MSHPIGSAAGSPLQPVGDRVDRIVVVLAVMVTLVAAPVAAGVGTAVYDAHRALYVQQAIARQNITATVTEGSIAPDLRRNTAG